MAQVFARYAKDILERQTYPEVRRAPNAPPEPPYDVSAWSLGMLLGVEHVGREVTAAGDGRAWRSSARPRPLPGRSKAAGRASRSTIAVRMPRSPSTGCSQTVRQYRSTLARDGGRPIGRVVVTGAPRGSLDKIAADLGFTLRSESQARGGVAIKAPRIGMYDTWNGGNMDEGWTRWVLEQYGFRSTRLHNADVRAGGLSRQVRRDHPAGSESHTRSSKGIRRARPVLSIAAASATRAWRR